MVKLLIDGRPVTEAELPLQRAVRENREIPPMELEVVLPSGRRWFAAASGAPIRDGQGNVISGVAVTVDLTERKQLEQQRQTMIEAERAARMELERLVRLNDEFLATVSHELRSPLGAIVGWSRLLVRGKADPPKAA